MSQDILNELSNHIRRSIKSDEYFSRESLIRGVVYNYFLKNYQNANKIKGDQILDEVAKNTELTNDEEIKLEHIILAWQEWDYILNAFGHPEAPSYKA